jgi:tRNA pseudouridine38-40 synthase
VPPKSDRTQLLVRFGYAGGRFYGLNPQPELPTAGLALRHRLEAAAEGQRAGGLCFVARTDRGVSARENWATCWFREPPDLCQLGPALAAERDDGLTGVAAWRVPWTTHARALAAGKHYRYRLQGGADPVFAEAVAEASRGLPEMPAPFPREVMQVWQVVPALDLAAMRAAAAHLVGTHDFSSFRGGPPDQRPPVRTVHRITLEERDGYVVVDVVGQGFLRKMVRILVGTLAEVGIGWRAPDDLPRLLAARDRRQAGPTAPARALWLERVLLREEVEALLTEEARVTPPG